MSKAEEARRREQRLAAKLRENLKRRKQALKAQGQTDAAPDGQAEGAGPEAERKE